MIVVIADDFSGAAEIANAAVQAGLSAEVQLGFHAGSHADVICVDSETRSRSSETAASRVEEITRLIEVIHPELVYKKCDSVLRGPVAAESLAVARVLEKKRVLLLPANPSRQRIIRNGEYFISGIPLAQTAFASDPDHPRRTSRIAELLGPAPDIETPDVASAEDLNRYARAITADVLPVGGVDFFNALLAMRSLPAGAGVQGLTRLASQPPGPSLFVCGSLDAWLAGRSEQCASHRIPVHVMPRGLFDRDLREDVLVRWAGLAATSLRERGAALLAIGGDEPVPGMILPTLADRLAQAVELVLEQAAPARVFLEGGATAAAVMVQLGLQRFRVEASPGPGIGVLQPVGQAHPLFVIKPGSYAWPETVWTVGRG